MAGSYLGSGDLAFVLPGSRLRQVGSALVALRSAATVAAGAMATEAGCFSGQISLIAGAQASISAVALASLNASIAGSLSATASLTASLTDPAAYVAELGAAVQGVLSVLLSGPPLPTVAASLESSASVGLDLKAEAAEITLQIAALTGISLAASACVVELLAAEKALLSAVAAAAGAASAYQDADAKLSAGPAWALGYSGSLAGLGSGLDAVSPLTGLGPSDLVTVTVQVVRQSDPAPSAAQAAFLRVP